MGADYYKLLGVDKNADENEIKKAYKKMVSAYRRRATMSLTIQLGLEMASR